MRNNVLQYRPREEGPMTNEGGNNSWAIEQRPGKRGPSYIIRDIYQGLRDNSEGTSPGFRGYWDGLVDWYDRQVGHLGHEYHRSVILPKVLEWLKYSFPVQSIIDMGFGQGPEPS